MNKEIAEGRLDFIMGAVDELMWEVIDEISDLEDTEHELHSILSTITDMYEIYERDIHIGGVRRLSQ